MSTELLVTDKQANNTHQSLSLIRDGVAGNKDAVKEIIRLIRSTISDKGFSDYAAHVLLENNLDSNSSDERQLEAVYNNVRNHVRYVDDPAGEVESIKSARQTLLDGYGDCDDFAVLTSSLVAALGFSPILILAKYDSDANAPYGHIYTQVTSNEDGKTYTFDYVIPNGKFNDEVVPLQEFFIDVFASHQSVDSLGAITANTIRTAKKTAHKLAGITKQVLPLAGFFVPSLSAAAGVASLIPEPANHFDNHFQQAAKAINKELNSAITDVHNNLMRAIDAKKVAQKMQALINNVVADTKNEIVIKNSIQQRIDYINSLSSENDLNDNTIGLVLLGVTGLVLGYAYFNNSKWLKRYI